MYSGVVHHRSVHSLMHPAPIEAVPVALGVLALAGVLEGYTMKVSGWVLF